MGVEWNQTHETIKAGLGKGFLYCLIGDRGTGKTQMGVELIHENIEQAVKLHTSEDRYFDPLPYITARYITAMDFFMDVKHSYRKESTVSEREVMERLVKPHLLVVDEISVRGQSKWEDDLFVQLVDKRYAAERDTLLIGNLKPSEVMDNVGPSISSRLQEMGGIIQCQWESFRKKA